MPLTSVLQFHKRPINAYLLMALVAGYLLISANFTFFAVVDKIYPFGQNIGFILSLAIVLFGVLLLLIVLLGYRYTLKAVLCFLLVVASITGYFTDTYGTVYDTNMLQNALQTDTAETSDLLNIMFIMRVILLGIFPSWLIIRQTVYFPTFGKSVLQRGLTFVVSLALIGLPILAFSQQYASFFRTHKPLRFYTNPVTPVYAVGKLASIEYKKYTAPKDVIFHAQDAYQTTSPTQRTPKLVVFVVGETARADHVSLNGYHRDTFPQLAKIQGLANFSQVISCGTSTAYSVPCMFSYLGADKYDVDTANYHENVLETLNRLKINILWRDNNSDSKGVMNRLPASQYFNYKDNKYNTICNNEHNECRDTGMLVGLDDYVKQHSQQDILIVLHQMGNHGPAYYKRYDKAFEKFTPVCQTNELAKCDRQTVINAFDNALLATDDFLAKTIQWLQQYDNSHDVAMLYVSDHGESLGEKGVYLHGMPNAFAPIEQKHIPAFFWAGQYSKVTPVTSNTALTHDAITPTLLKLFDVNSEAVKNKQMFIK